MTDQLNLSQGVVQFSRTLHHFPCLHKHNATVSCGVLFSHTRKVHGLCNVEYGKPAKPLFQTFCTIPPSKQCFNSNPVDKSVKHQQCVRYGSAFPAVIFGCWRVRYLSVKLVQLLPPPSTVCLLTCDSWECHTKHFRLNYQTEATECCLT